MKRFRIIPCLLLQWTWLVKTVKFKNPNYIWDPINAVKIFNDKWCDELVFIDIESSKKNTGINFDLLAKIAVQSFMPLGYGWGIKTLEDAKKIFSLWFEKIILNSIIFENPDIIKEISTIYWNQAVSICIDIKKNLLWKYRIYNHINKKNIDTNPINFIKNLEKLWAGEIILQSVDMDWKMEGYDFKLIQDVSNKLEIPVVALWWAGKLSDFKKAIEHWASAVSAGSLFIYYGPHKAVLINYPEENEVKDLYTTL